MALNPVTVANSIAAISVTGLTIKDIDEIPENITQRDCPILIPAPQFVTNFRHARNSFGTGSTAKQSAQYTLNYRLFYQELGASRGLRDAYSGMVEMVGLIWDALISNSELTGAVDVIPRPISGFGVVASPNDKGFYGCDFSVDIMEFVN